MSERLEVNEELFSLYYHCFSFFSFCLKGKKIYKIESTSVFDLNHEPCSLLSHTNAWARARTTAPWKIVKRMAGW